MKKRLKLPNGFGSITRKADGRRRKPYVVRKTIGGKQIAIGYFATYEEAIAFLVEANKNPHIYSPSQITFSEMYHCMAAERFLKIAKSTQSNYRAAYKHCEALYDKRFVELRISDLQDVIRVMSEKGVGYASQKKCRQLLHHVYSYAVKYEFISPSADITRYIDIDKNKTVYPKKPFNVRQLNRVRALITEDNPLSLWAMCVVMACYAGPRPSEFIHVLKTDVKLRQRFFVIRDSKTEAGRNRIVPIIKKTLPYFQHWMQMPGKTLISDETGNPLSYHQYRSRFDKVMKASRCQHTPHECRHTCATMLDNKNANEVAVKKILGHACQGITQGVYTHKGLRELKQAIDLL